MPCAEPASNVRYAAHLASMVVFKYFSTAFDFHLPRSMIVFSGTRALCSDVAPPRRSEWVVALTGMAKPRLRWIRRAVSPRKWLSCPRVNSLPALVLNTAPVQSIGVRVHFSCRKWTGKATNDGVPLGGDSSAMVMTQPSRKMSVLDIASFMWRISRVAGCASRWKVSWFHDKGSYPLFYVSSDARSIALIPKAVETQNDGSSLGE